MSEPPLSFDQLRAEFDRLVWVIFQILGQSLNWKNNLEACKNLSARLRASDNAEGLLFNAKSLTEINKCKDFRQLLEIVNLHLSWDEYSILNEILNKCNSYKAGMKFMKYKKKLTVSNDLEITSTKSSPPPGFQEFSVTLNKPYKILTVEKYKELKTFIFNSLDVHCYVTTGHIKVLYDPLHLEWHVTMQAISRMVKIAHEKQDFFKRHAFVFMQIGKEVILGSPTERHK